MARIIVIILTVLAGLGVAQDSIHAAKVWRDSQLMWFGVRIFAIAILNGEFVHLQWLD